MGCGTWVHYIIGASIGSVLVIFGVFALTLVPSIVDDAVVKRDHLGYELVNDSRVLNSMTEQWRLPPYEMRMHIWIFDVQNPSAVMKGAKPQVKQIGPFTFVERQEKNFTFARNDTRVLYRNNHLYFFNSSLSCRECSLSRKVTVPNVLFQKLVDVANMNLMYKIAIEATLVAFKRENIFVHVTAGEALFEGYKDPIIEAVCSKPILRSICKTAQIPEKIGFFYGQNNTNDGVYEVSTGLEDPMQIGKMFTWNNLTEISTAWDVPYAGRVEGTDGQLFPPLIKKGQPLHIFAAQICRSIVMTYDKVSAYRDVPSYRFSVPSSMYDPSLPENKRYCNSDNTPTFFNSSIQIPGCLPAGLLDISRCLPGSPRIYISQAHFLDAPQQVWSSVGGLDRPSPDNDVTFVDIEPTSGVPIQAKRVMQINVGMVKANLSILANTSNLIMPVLWMNETAFFDDATRDQLLNQLVFAKHVAFVSGLGLIAVGSLMIVALSVILLICKVAKPSSNEDEQPIIQNTEETIPEEEGEQE